MNRGSDTTGTTSDERRSGFNEAPIHESGKVLLPLSLLLSMT